MGGDKLPSKRDPDQSSRDQPSRDRDTSSRASSGSASGSKHRDVSPQRCAQLVSTVNL